MQSEHSMNSHEDSLCLNFGNPFLKGIKKYRQLPLVLVRLGTLIKILIIRQKIARVQIRGIISIIGTNVPHWCLEMGYINLFTVLFSRMCWRRCNWMENRLNSILPGQVTGTIGKAWHRDIGQVTHYHTVWKPIPCDMVHPRNNHCRRFVDTITTHQVPS